METSISDIIGIMFLVCLGVISLGVITSFIGLIIKDMKKR